MDLNVLGRDVIVQPFIHVFIGDAQGNNTLLGHYNGSGELKYPYRDCKYKYPDMDDPNPQCTYVTISSMKKLKRRKRKAIRDNASKKKRKKIYQNASKHDVDIIFNQPDFPLADDIHGLYGMTPPDKLHASYSGLLKYAMETLQHMYGKRKKQLLALAMLDELHQDLCFILSRNSERDRPRPSVRNGVMDSTKTQSSERLGNFYNLLCLSHTTK